MVDLPPGQSFSTHESVAASIYAFVSRMQLGLGVGIIREVVGLGECYPDVCNNLQSAVTLRRCAEKPTASKVAAVPVSVAKDADVAGK